MTDNENIKKKDKKEGKFESLQESLIRRFSKSLATPKPVVFEFTDDPALLHQYYSLRDETFFPEHGVDARNGADIYDKISEILIARRGKQLLGACRLTVREPDEKFLLPMESEQFQLRKILPNLPLEKERHAVISKFVIVEEHRAHEILYGLCSILFDRVIATDTPYVFARAETYALGRNWRLIANSFGARNTKICMDIDVPENPHVPGVKRYLTYSDMSQHCQNHRPRVPVPKKRELSLVED